MGRDMPETSRQKMLIKNLDLAKNIVIFLHIGFNKLVLNKMSY